MSSQTELQHTQTTESSSLSKRIVDYLSSAIPTAEKLQLIDELLFSFTLKVDLLLSPKLTEREQECFRLLALGHDTYQVARVLGISQRTVEKHSASIKEKLKAENLIQAIREGMKWGYLPPKLKNFEGR